MLYIGGAALCVFQGAAQGDQFMFLADQRLFKVRYQQRQQLARRHIFRRLIGFRVDHFHITDEHVALIGCWRLWVLFPAIAHASADLLSSLLISGVTNCRATV
jgi:hypothetical protein